MADPPVSGLPPLGGSTTRRRHGGGSAPAVPDRLVAVLRRARAIEMQASGPDRLPALQRTRYLIAGVRSAGYPDALIAEHLDITVDSVRTRGGSDGWIAAEDYAALADVTLDVIEQWAADGLLPTAATDGAGRRYYAASELIRALGRLGYASDREA